MAGSDYKKTRKSYVGRDGVKRAVYTKGGKFYVKKLSKATKTFVWREVKV